MTNTTPSPEWKKEFLDRFSEGGIKTAQMVAFISDLLVEERNRILGVVEKMFGAVEEIENAEYKMGYHSALQSLREKLL